METQYSTERTTRTVKLGMDEYKALLNGSERARNNYVMNHFKAFGLGFGFDPDRVSIEGTSVERVG